VRFLADGTVRGHPNEDDSGNLRWSCTTTTTTTCAAGDDDAASSSSASMEIRWGYSEGTQWAPGVVRRTATWGWEIWSVNVVLRVDGSAWDDLWPLRVVTIKIGAAEPADFRVPDQYLAWLRARGHLRSPGEDEDAPSCGALVTSAGLRPFRPNFGPRVGRRGEFAP